MATYQPDRLNRFALSALIERSAHPSRSAFAREVGMSRGALADLLSGRRDASDEVMVRCAVALGVPVGAISNDPYGVVGPLLGVLREAERLVGAGVDGELRRAVRECRKVGLS